MKLKLSEVTLCAVDCVTPKLSLLAINKSLENCDFHHSILFTDQPIDKESNCQVVPIRKLTSIDDYSYFLLKDLSTYITTPYVLVIQWDGYVIDHNAWSNEFFEFDYIGAKWEWHKDGMNVGNGGFSLRSNKILEATRSETFQYLKGIPEDDLICRRNRSYLVEKYGIKFAPEQIADRFSYERSTPDAPTFGFHGLFNMWRHCNDEEIYRMIEHLSTRTYLSREFAELLIQYFIMRKFKPLASMYRKIKTVQSHSDFCERITKLTNNSQFSIHLTNLCESLIKY